ncbi:uncharacterized protein BJ171DRAFT_594400 [Polychytrium aggregatum]|uniref:uncharacterized protein n=1 Tax=Polychytrium aggregatum TaxID=110093 RepID=UPI0022FE744F|nr:uncharacterized protein BJ171DRAFT_594400 [Polychytrium aggregatum]KAI9179329.1 hypothetical protein BJ171DRAFT_594400 [Polychytrium aggregatum]
MLLDLLEFEAKKDREEQQQHTVSDTDDDTGISDADVDDDFDDRDRLWSSLPGVIARMGRLRLTGPEVDSDLGSEVSSVSDYDIDFDFLYLTPTRVWT